MKEIKKYKKTYSDKNVYEETQERLKFLFEEFDNIYISFICFSGKYIKYSYNI